MVITPIGRNVFHEAPSKKKPVGKKICFSGWSVGNVCVSGTMPGAETLITSQILRLRGVFWNIRKRFLEERNQEEM